MFLNFWKCNFNFNKNDLIRVRTQIDKEIKELKTLNNSNYE